MNVKSKNPFGVVAVLVVATSLGLGFWIVGSPMEARNRKLDERRISDLNHIYSSIQNYIFMYHHAPDKLKALGRIAGSSDTDYSWKPDIKDPETRKEYGFRKIDTEQLELCAEFKTDTTTEHEFFGGDARFQRHKKGHVCFTLPSVGKAP